MVMATLIEDAQALSTNDTFSRAVKTFIEVTAAQAALYTTVIPNTPPVRTSGAISLGATVLAVAWNLALAWATKAKSAKLDALAAAIDKVVDQRLTEQAMQNAAAMVPETPRQQNG